MFKLTSQILSTLFIVIAFSQFSLADSVGEGEQAQKSPMEQISSYKWTVNWVDGGGHHRKKDQFLLTFNGALVNGLEIASEGSSVKTKISGGDSHPNLLVGAGDLWATSFYFKKPDGKHGDHLHRAHLIFNLGEEKPTFVYDIVDIPNDNGLAFSAHGKGGGTGD